MSEGRPRVAACEVCGTEKNIPRRVLMLHGKVTRYCPTCGAQRWFVKVERKDA